MSVSRYMEFKTKHTKPVQTHSTVSAYARANFTIKGMCEKKCRIFSLVHYSPGPFLNLIKPTSNQYKHIYTNTIVHHDCPSCPTPKIPSTHTRRKLCRSWAPETKIFQDESFQPFQRAVFYFWRGILHLQSPLFLQVLRFNTSHRCIPSSAKKRELSPHGWSQGYHFGLWHDGRGNR